MNLKQKSFSNKFFKLKKLSYMIITIYDKFRIKKDAGIIFQRL